MERFPCLPLWLADLGGIQKFHERKIVDSRQERKRRLNKKQKYREELLEFWAARSNDSNKEGDSTNEWGLCLDDEPNPLWREEVDRKLSYKVN
jgi:hypothetical protein